MRTILLSLFVVSIGGAPVRAAEMFPLAPGAVWEYRADGVAEPLVVEVMLNQLYSRGAVYSRLKGYVNEPVWVRLNEAGDLVRLDEETQREQPLTMFAVDDRAWFEAPMRECDQEGQAHSDKVPYSGRTGRIEQTVAIRYRSFGCADAGVEYEQFAANIGMVSRSVTTIAGPRVYRLVYADTGSVQLAPRRGATLRLALEPKDENWATARLRLTGDAHHPPTLRFPSSQEFDLFLRNAEGKVVWKWSDGRVFLPATLERQGVNLAYEGEFPISGLPPGVYTVEARLMTADPEQSPRVSSTFTIQGQGEPQRKAVKPLRARR